MLFWPTTQQIMIHFLSLSSSTKSIKKRRDRHLLPSSFSPMALPWQLQQILLTDLSLPILLLTAVIALTLYRFFKPNNNVSLPLPPGPRGLPVVGNLPFLHPELHSYFASLTQIYGPVLKLKLGTKLGIVVASPDAAKQVLKDHDLTFANRDVPAAGRIAAYGGVDIVWTPYGPEWRMLRKVVVLKMLSNATLDSVYELRRREIRKTVGYFHDRVGSPVNIGEQMFLTVLNVITNMMWGGTLIGNESRILGSEFRQVVNEMTALLGTPNVSDFFPGLARFDLQGVEKRMSVLAKQFDGIFETVIEKRLKMEERRGNGGNEESSKDFLQFLLKVKDEEDAKTPLSMTGLKALLMDMVVGGTDTSSNTVEFAMSEILNQPHIMKRVQKELDDVIGQDSFVEESHIHNLPYLRSIMNETLRLHPVLPLLVPHCPSADSTIAGFHIPKGSRVFVNVWAIHRDPTIWENPTDFNPDRFFGNGKWDYSGNDFRYFPFGSGRRICAGIAMAERMVMYSLATLLHSFDWKLPAGDEKLDLSEKFGIVLKKKVPLVVIPTARLREDLYK